jgi:uncharacterized membrane protein YidH (DUF202 family)
MAPLHKTLTPAEIDVLYDFTRRHFVVYYDLQTELTDHLANAIEQQWAVNPNLAFGDALNAEFKKFGIFGFSDIVAQRQAALTKRYYKLIWGYAKDFLRLPKIGIALAGMVVAFKLLLLIPYFIAIFTGVLAVVGIVRFTMLNRQFKKQEKATGKRWMFQENIYRCAGSGMFFYIFFQLVRFEGGEGSSLWFAAVAAVVIVLYALCNYITLFVIPARAEEHLKSVYPEYGLEISG